VPHLTVCCGAPGPCRDDAMCPYHQGPEVSPNFTSLFPKLPCGLEPGHHFTSGIDALQVWYDNGMVGPGGFKMCRGGE
jgi:hypothetical protein